MMVMMYFVATMRQFQVFLPFFQIIVGVLIEFSFARIEETMSSLVAKFMRFSTSLVNAVGVCVSVRLKRDILMGPWTCAL